MFTFFKANMASLIASFFDYMITIIAVQFFDVNVVLASIGGNIFGGVINFILGRHWVFAAKEVNGFGQAKRYFLVWVGNLLLNASGMYLFTKTGLYYVVTKFGTSLLVSVCYNYPLQKGYVFKNRLKYDLG
ncbi:MAG: GtrA family protein [Ginsengibacter sp.]|jgi:putative flippase GtrA